MLNAGEVENMPVGVDLGCSCLKMAQFVGMVRVFRRLAVLKRLFLPIMSGSRRGPKGR